MRRPVLLGAIAWVSLSASFGQVINCPSATSVQSGVTVPGAGPGNDLAGNAQGCLWIDKIFSNFATQPGLASESDVYFFVAPFDNTLDPVANPVSVTFATVRGDGSGRDGSDNDGVNNFTGGAGNGSLRYLAQVSGGTTNAINQIGLTFNLANIPSLDQLGFTLTVCLDGSSLPVTFDPAGCIAAGGSSLQSVTYSFSGPLSGTLHQDFILSHPVTSLALDNVFDFGTSSNFLTFSQEFVDPIAPEPSSLVLCGSALAGVGFLRYLWCPITTSVLMRRPVPGSNAGMIVMENPLVQDLLSSAALRRNHEVQAAAADGTDQSPRKRFSGLPLFL